jgi:hypothetical protein
MVTLSYLRTYAADGEVRVWLDDDNGTGVERAAAARNDSASSSSSSSSSLIVLSTSSTDATAADPAAAAAAAASSVGRPSNYNRPQPTLPVAIQR